MFVSVHPAELPALGALGDFFVILVKTCWQLQNQANFDIPSYLAEENEPVYYKLSTPHLEINAK